MKVALDFEVFIGTTRGAIIQSRCRADEKAKYNLQQIESEITALEWGRSDNEILIGRKDGVVKFYNGIDYGAEIENDGKEAVVGLGCLDKNVVIGRQNGVINVRRKHKNESFSLNLDEGASMLHMICNKGRNVVATGGEKNDLKVWDLETKTTIFKAKSMGHDELNLPIPTTVRSICFFPTEENLVACATKEGNVLLYDERAQRRPIMKFFEVKASYTTISTAYRDRQILTGTTKGYLQLIDLKQNKCSKTFKSFTGGITSIVCDPIEPFVATTSLDRHLRIHNLETKELVHKEYLKMGLTKILMKPIIKEEPKDEIPEAEKVDEEFENLFENMEKIVEEASPKKRKIKNKLKSIKKVKNVEN